MTGFLFYFESNLRKTCAVNYFSLSLLYQTIKKKITMTNSRIFKIAHRSVRFYAAYNTDKTYAERLSIELKKQFKLEREANEDGTIARRIEIQELLIAA